MSSSAIEAGLLDSQERWTEVECAYCLAPPRSLCYCRQAYQLGAQARQEAIVAKGREWVTEMDNSSVGAVGLGILRDWFDDLESGAALEADGNDKST